MWVNPEPEIDSVFLIQMVFAGERLARRRDHFAGGEQRRGRGQAPVPAGQPLRSTLSGGIPHPLII